MRFLSMRLQNPKSHTGADKIQVYTGFSWEGTPKKIYAHGSALISDWNANVYMYRHFTFSFDLGHLGFGYDSRN